MSTTNPTEVLQWLRHHASGVNTEVVRSIWVANKFYFQCKQICDYQQICSNLLNKSLKEFFCVQILMIQNIKYQHPSQSITY